MALALSVGCASGAGSPPGETALVGAGEPESAENSRETPRSEETESRLQKSADLPQVKAVAGSDATGVLWCSSGGAPIVGLPVLDAEERAYVATSDGYLHAFERDGRFRWSYTVKGTPLGSVSLRPGDGAILIGTTARYVYAIHQSGVLHWSFHTLTPVWSGLFQLNPSTVVFLGHDRRLYALSPSGAARYRVRAPGEPMGGPVVAENDVVWLPLADGLARFESAARLLKYPLPAPVEQVVTLGSGVVAQAGERAYFVSADGVTKDLGAVHFVSASESAALLLNEDGTGRVIGADLTVAKLPWQSGDVASKISAAPAFAKDAVWIPLDDGSLVVRSVRNAEMRFIKVQKRALSTPVLGASGTWALSPDPGGNFCAVTLGRR